MVDMELVINTRFLFFHLYVTPPPPQNKTCKMPFFASGPLPVIRPLTYLSVSLCQKQQPLVLGQMYGLFVRNSQPAWERRLF